MLTITLQQTYFMFQITLSFIFSLCYLFIFFILFVSVMQVYLERLNRIKTSVWSVWKEIDCSFKESAPRPIFLFYFKFKKRFKLELLKCLQCYVIVSYFTQLRI